MIRILLVTSALLLLGFGLFKLFVIGIEPKLTFFPSPEIKATPADHGINFEQFRIPTSDGEKLTAWYLESDRPVARILFFHGNAGNVSSGRLDLLIGLCRHGFSVFVFDYRGFGTSSGSPSERGLYRDARAAANFFREELPARPDLPVIYLGRSLGGPVAARASTVEAPDGLILEATFPDKFTLLEEYPWPLRALAFFSRYRFDTIAHLSEFERPVLVLHGDRDRIVPLEVGKELYRQIPADRKEFVLFEGSGHGDLYSTQPERYWETLREFAESLREATNGQH